MAGWAYANLLNSGAPWQTTQGTALSTAATATISPQATGPQDFVLPGQVLGGGLQWYQGMSLMIEAHGVISSGGTTSNLTVFLAAGVSATLGTTLSTTAAIALGAGSLSSLNWHLWAQVDVVGLRTDANPFLATEGSLVIGMTSAAPAIGTANGLVVGLPFTNVNGSTLSPYTTQTAIGLRATLSAAFGSIQCNRFKVFQLN
jgi:hypothetical protein